MSNPVRYTMVPEHEWLATQSAFRSIASILKDFNYGRLPSDEETLDSINVIVEALGRSAPTLRLKDERTASD